MTEQPIIFKEEYLTRKIDINFESEGLPKLALVLKPKRKIISIILKIIAVLAAVWSILLIETETTLIFSKKEIVSVMLNRGSENVWFTFIFTTLVLLLTVSTAFFTIFKLKFSDYLQLVAGHTDAVTFASFCGLFS